MDVEQSTFECVYILVAHTAAYEVMRLLQEVQQRGQTYECQNNDN